MPVLELVSANFNSLYRDGKIYKVTFDNRMVYVGSTCEDLALRLKWHLSNKNSQVFKHKDKNPEIELIVLAPSFDRKSLEKVENGYISEYAEKHGKLLNVKCNPLKKTKKVEHEVKMENKSQLEERIALLEKNLTIKDDEKIIDFTMMLLLRVKGIKVYQGTKDVQKTKHCKGSIQRERKQSMNLLCTLTEFHLHRRI